jgi:hypothetical protein
MPSPRRPGAATAAGVLAIIYGSLGLLCGVCGLASLLIQGAGGNNMFFGGDPAQADLQKKLQDALARDLPAYEAVQIGGNLLGLIEAVALLVGGIGVLNMRRWARTLVMTFSFIAIASGIFQVYYQTVFVFPSMNNVFQNELPGLLPAGPAPQAAQVMSVMRTMVTAIAVVTIVILVVVMIYLFIIIMLLARPHVRAAFASQDQMDYLESEREGERARRDYDEDDDWGRGERRREEPRPDLPRPDDPEKDWRIK